MHRAAAAAAMLMLMLLLMLVGAAEQHLPLQRSAFEGATAFARGMDDVGALSRALGETDPSIDLWERDLKRRVGAAVKGALSQMLGKVEEDACAARGAAQQLRDKVLHQGVSRVRAAAKEALRTLLGTLGQGRRNLDDCMDHVARLRFSDVEQLMRREVSSSEGVRECLDSFPNTELSNALQGAAFPLAEGEQEKLRAYGAWTRDVWRGGANALRGQFAALKGEAMELISQSKEAAASACRTALDALRPFEGPLGQQWGRLQQVTIEAVGHF